MIRNQTRTKLNRQQVEKKTLSPIAKKKRPFKPILYNKKSNIQNVNERLYNAAQRRQPTYKTLAELVQDFDKKTRVYEDENYENNSNNNLKKHQLIIARSPKLLSKFRIRTRTALSQLEKDELIARTIKKNTFRAQPINKKIFDNYATGIPKIKSLTCSKKTTAATTACSLLATKRLEMRKEKMQAIQQSIANVNFVFKARPMPIFYNRKIPIMMRNNQLIKKQSSEMCLNKLSEKMTNTVIKQHSDSTLTRIAHQMNNLDDFENYEKADEDFLIENNDQENIDLNNQEAKELIERKSINASLSTFKIEEESSFCEFKSLTNFENSKDYEQSIDDLKNGDENLECSVPN